MNPFFDKKTIRQNINFKIKYISDVFSIYLEFFFKRLDINRNTILNNSQYKTNRGNSFKAESYRDNIAKLYSILKTIF